LRSFLDGVELAGPRRYQVELTFDEIAGNIIRHGLPATDIDVVVAVDAGEMVMTFEDDGVMFDPRAARTRPSDASLQHAPAGGLGIALVRRFATRFEYERTPRHRNRLSVAIPLT
jgi:anti-sigma regulatory factor (Ser/Thr protein kinase)